MNVVLRTNALGIWEGEGSMVYCHRLTSTPGEGEGGGEGGFARVYGVVRVCECGGG